MSKQEEETPTYALPYEGGTKGDICEASIPIFCKGFKAGIAYERERMMKKGDDGLEKMIDDFEDWDGSYSRADLPTSYTTRDIARFFANWQRERLMKGAVDGMIKADRVISNRYAVFAEVNPKKFKPGEEVDVIIIKK